MSDDLMQNYGLYRAEVEFEPENVADDEKPNKDFVIPSELEIRMAEAEGFKEFYGAVGVGLTSGTLGLPGTMEQLYSGTAKVVSQPKQNLLNLFGQFAQQHGHEEVGKAIQTLTGSPQNLSALEAFAQGLAEETVFPTYEDVKEWLASKGLAFDNEAGELIGDLLSLNIIPGLASITKKTGKAILDKTTPDPNAVKVVKKKFQDRHAQEKITHNVYSKNGILSDETGEPMTFYHGTMEKFDEFDLSKSHKPVVYFANKEEVAKQYTTQKGSRKKGTIKAANLKMDKPFIVTDFEFTSGLGEDMAIIYNKIMNKIKKTYEKSYSSNQWSVDEDTVRRLKNKGYDGIIVPEEASPRRQAFYMVFDTDQIKVTNK